MSYNTGIELRRRKRSGSEYTMEEATDKVYIVKTRPNQSTGILYLPKVLVGKRIKIQLVED